MLQLLGASMVFLGIMGIGYQYIEKEKNTLAVIIKWERIMQMFISEISYKKQPLSFACYEISKKTGYEEGECLRNIADKMTKKRGENFWKIWEQESEIYGKRVNLSREVTLLITEFGKVTGFEDEEIQTRMITELGEQWKGLRMKKEKEHQERKRLIWILSSCLGLMLILILW